MQPLVPLKLILTSWYTGLKSHVLTHHTLTHIVTRCLLQYVPQKFAAATADVMLLH